jgi:hypothetical protein
MARLWIEWPGWALLLVVGCGGSTGPAKSVPSETEESGNVSEDADLVPVLDCSNRTCQRCGPGICPEGSYCDESAGGGPACSWIPQCVDTVGCDCLVDVLGSRCDCEERDGGRYVKCR